MQVSHAQPSDNYAIVGGGKSRDFQIASSAHAFKILSDALYRDKEGAVVRETICNAKDAHIAMGKPDHPIRLTLTDTEFSIEDDGPGIPDDKMVDVYLTYFGSTKTNDDRQIGGFGLGCKAPFCLTDHFMVTSRCNGIQSTYALTAGNDDTNGKPSIQLMASMPTKLTGLKVTIPIERDKKPAFSNAIERVLREGGIQAMLNGEEVTGVRNYSGIAKSGFALFTANSSSISVLYGSVLYPLDQHEQTREIIKDLTGMIRGGNQAIVLYAPPSSIAVTPSRESMGYNEKTLETLNAVARRALNQVRQHLPRARRELFAKILERNKTRRHDFASLTIGHGSLSARKTRPGYTFDQEHSFVDIKDIVGVIAENTIEHGDSWLNREEFARFAAKYYRDHSRTLKVIGRAHRQSEGAIKRDQYQYTLRKIMRAVLPEFPGETGSGFNKQWRLGIKYTAVELTERAKKKLPLSYENKGSVGPTIAFMGGQNTRFVNANFGLRDHLKYRETMGVTSMRVILAPSRISAEYLGGGFLVITKDMKPAQVERIRNNAERQHLKVIVVTPEVKVRPKHKVLAEDKPTEKFSKFNFERSAGSIASDRTSRFVVPPATLETPTSFAALSLVRRKLKVIRPVKPPGFIGPWPVFDEEFKLHQCVSQRDAGKITGLDIDLENCAIPASIAERDRLLKLGVPRFYEKVLANLRGSFDPTSQTDAFTAYLASISERCIYSAAPRFAMRLAGKSRRLACAVYLQPYEESPEQDEIFKLWKQTHEVFDVSLDNSDWLDEVECDALLKAKKQFQNLLSEFSDALPRDFEAFLKRMRASRLTPEDTAHLNFLAAIVDLTEIRQLDAEGLERLAVLIEQEGERYLAGPIPTISPTEEDTDDE